MKFAKILRAARAATKYATGHEWQAGVCDPSYNQGFKPAFIPTLPMGLRDDEVSRSWGGEYAPWSAALKRAEIGTRFDFYVRNREELVTNVYVMIVSETEAVVCDCGEKPFTVSIQ